MKHVVLNTAKIIITTGVAVNQTDSYCLSLFLSDIYLKSFLLLTKPACKVHIVGNLTKKSLSLQSFHVVWDINFHYLCSGSPHSSASCKYSSEVLMDREGDRTMGFKGKGYEHSQIVMVQKSLLNWYTGMIPSLHLVIWKANQNVSSECSTFGHCDFGALWPSQPFSCRTIGHSAESHWNIISV